MIAFLGLGSSIGEKQKTLESAIKSLRSHGDVLAISSFLESEPWGGKANNTFLNAVIKFDTTLSAEELLFTCQKIEAEHGRTREIHWGDRTLDIDILLYDNQLIQTENLTIPHQHMLERDFVMTPLKEITDIEIQENTIRFKDQ